MSKTLTRDHPVLPQTLEEDSRSHIPLVSIGWVLATDERDQELLDAYEQARQQVVATLVAQFPQFRWEMPFLQRPRYLPRGALDPLLLLELGSHEKINGNWDYALVIVPNELVARSRIFTIGVPSSALEVGAISTLRLEGEYGLPERLAGLALHLLGHLWGLEHSTEGPMAPPEICEALQISSFPPEQQAEIVDRLEEVADKRLEEQHSRWRWLPFHWQSFWADPEGILTDIWGYKPWRLPFRMGRLTAAAAGSILFLLLGAEAWEIGINASILTLSLGAITAILGGTLLIFLGQNLSQISREIGWREQLARTRIVLFLTLFLGVFVLWLALFGASYLVAAVVPRAVPNNWLGQALTPALLARHAAFMATMGVLAGALGGNLEEEAEIKAQLFYDEET